MLARARQALHMVAGGPLPASCPDPDAALSPNIIIIIIINHYYVIIIVIVIVTPQPTNQPKLNKDLGRSVMHLCLCPLHLFPTIS